MLARPEPKKPTAVDLAAAVAAEIAAAKPGRLARAEEAVREIRGRLAEANEAARSAIVTRQAAPGGSAHASGDAVNRAVQVARQIEAELKPARAELAAAREAAAPAIRAALDARLAAIASNLAAAADDLHEPLAALVAIDAGFSRLGLDRPRRSGQAPDLNALRQLAHSLSPRAAHEKE